ncbi:g9835 [Coccomyxa elongata]
MQEDLAAAKRDSDRLQTERERALDAESRRVFAAEQRAQQLRDQMEGKGTKSGSGTDEAAHKEGKGKAPKPSEKLHGSKHSQAPVASGLDILDEDDRKPGCDPDKLSPGRQSAGAKSMEASVKAKEVQEQLAQEAEEAAKLREKPQRPGHSKHGKAMMSTQADPDHVKEAAKQTADKTTETAKEKAHKAKEYVEDRERAKAAAHETAQQTAHKTKHAKEEITQTTEETAPGVTGKAKAVVQKADDAVEVSAQTVEGTLRTAAGAAKSAVDTLMGRRSEE